ncbi:MAG TPA: hypothetical protein VMJ64_15830 [Anaerolineales bacterium]|nr:hypothetical protein [Anaerolineales bacterium]
MFLDQSTPDTSVYMIAGYTIFFVITAIYVISLAIRERNLKRDLATLEALKMEQEQQAAAAAAAAPVAPGPARPRSNKPKPTNKKARRKQ